MMHEPRRQAAKPLLISIPALSYRIVDMPGASPRSPPKPWQKEAGASHCVQEVWRHYLLAGLTKLHSAKAGLSISRALAFFPEGFVLFYAACTNGGWWMRITCFSKLLTVSWSTGTNIMQGVYFWQTAWRSGTDGAGGGRRRRLESWPDSV